MASGDGNMKKKKLPARRAPGSGGVSGDRHASSIPPGTQNDNPSPKTTTMRPAPLGPRPGPAAGTQVKNAPAQPDIFQEVSWTDAHHKETEIPPVGSISEEIIQSLFRSLGTVVAIYPYVDAAGALLSGVVRLNPKSFRPFHLNERGEFVIGRGDADRVPYKLPEVLAAIDRGETIHIPEGEKSAEAMEALGFVATCNDGGAGKWTNAHSVYFAGADVVLWADNDKAGRAHVGKTAESLYRAGAASVQIVYLTGTPEKTDVFDLINAGATRADLLALVDRAPIYEPPTEPAPAPKARVYSSNSRDRDNDLSHLVKEHWTPYEVFEHFGMIQKGTRREKNGGIRVSGHGGLICHEDGVRWYCHSAGAGGDVFNAWAYAQSGTANADVPTGEDFVTLAHEMLRIKGVELPELVSRPQRDRGADLRRRRHKAPVQNRELPPQIEAVPGLETTTRRDVCAADKPDLGRLLDILYIAGVKPGDRVSAARAINYTSDFMGANKTRALLDDPVFEHVEPSEPPKRGRPQNVYIMPHPRRVRELYGRHGERHSSEIHELPPGTLDSTKNYRAWVQMCLIQQRAGTYSRAELARALRVSRSTTYRYQQELKDRYRVIPQIEYTPLSKVAASLPDKAVAFAGGRWIEESNGRAWPASKESAEYLRRDARARLCQRRPNYYEIVKPAKVLNPARPAALPEAERKILAALRGVKSVFSRLWDTSVSESENRVCQTREKIPTEPQKPRGAVILERLNVLTGHAPALGVA